jgi:uncharacterized protein (TIGR02271 family)
MATRKELVMAMANDTNRGKDSNPDPITGAPGSHPVGTGVGAAGGGAAGAAIGTAVAGPIGTAVGAVVGAVAGGLAGKGAAEAIDPTAEDAYWRENYKTRPYVSGNTRYDEVAPAYRFGWEARQKHQGKKFEEVEPNLRQDWEKTRATAKSNLTWDKAGAAARDAWNRVEQARIPVVEEELKVGKRQVEGGGVRVKTNVTETPVEEQVNLREEHVRVERRPVDRPATAADMNEAQHGRTLEVREKSEEAVVSKDARVVEEVVVGKEATERTETVRDTVRKTDVDVVEDTTRNRNRTNNPA